MAVRKLDPAVVDGLAGVTMKSDSTRIDPRKLKLDKGGARHDPRTLLLASYVTPALPAPPVSVDVSLKVKAWGVRDNDQIGDCTCAAAGHLIMEWTANSGNKMVAPTDQEIDVLNYWRQTGIARHKIGAYVALEPANHTHVMDSVYIFEGCYIGVQLPISAQALVQNHQP
jgi:hypothetical protein